MNSSARFLGLVFLILECLIPCPPSNLLHIVFSQLCIANGPRQYWHGTVLLWMVVIVVVALFIEHLNFASATMCNGLSYGFLVYSPDRRCDGHESNTIAKSLRALMLKFLRDWKV